MFHCNPGRARGGGWGGGGGLGLPIYSAVPATQTQISSHLLMGEWRAGGEVGKMPPPLNMK